MRNSLFFLLEISSSVSEHDRKLNAWKRRHFIRLMRWPNRLISDLDEKIGSRVMDDDHLDHLKCRVQVTGTMHKEIVLILWLGPEEIMWPEKNWDFGDPKFVAWVMDHHVDPVCGQHSSQVCKTLSDPRTGKHPIQDIEAPWVDVLCCVQTPDNIKQARSYGMRDNRKHEVTKKMSVANCLRYIHREYTELQAQCARLGKGEFDKRWKQRRVQVGSEVGMNKQTFGSHLTLAVRKDKTWLTLMRIVDGLIVRRGAAVDSKTVKPVQSTAPFTQLSGIPDNIALGILTKVQTGVVPLSNLNNMCKSLKVTLRIQQKIMDVLHFDDWAKTREKYPKATDRSFVHSWLGVFQGLRAKDPVPLPFLRELDQRKKQDSKSEQQDRVRSQEVDIFVFFVLYSCLLVDSFTSHASLC
jgi:hypothetical protein